MKHSRTLTLLLATGFTVGFSAVSPAQSPDQPPPTTEAESTTATTYKPPLRGAPGGRVGGASRSAAVPAGALPVVELIAPADHAGVTANPSPTLYYRVSGAVRWPMQLTISAPLQPAPVIETNIPAPPAAGLYALPLANYRVRLQPGVLYTWSVSVVVDPRAWSRNIVASAGIMFDPNQAAVQLASTAAPRRAAALAESGLWYDAVGAAAETPDQRRALDSLMRQVGLTASAGN